MNIFLERVFHMWGTYAYIFTFTVYNINYKKLITVDDREDTITKYNSFYLEDNRHEIK